MKKTLENNYLKLATTSDIFGVEMYGAIKNVIAIASTFLFFIFGSATFRHIYCIYIIISKICFYCKKLANIYSR